MYDAIDVNNLPAGGDLYAGYDDGNWPDADAIAQRFPGKELIRITVNPAHDYGVMGDGPPDNGTWPEWVAWVKMRRAAGADPWLNTNASSWQAGKDAFAAAKQSEPHWWIANYDNSPAIPGGALMKQYASNSSYDTSSCADYLPGIDPAPQPPAPPAPQTEETDMIYLCSTPNGIWAKFPDGSYVHVDDTAKLDSLKATGAKSIDLSAGMHASMIAQSPNKAA